MRLWRTAKCRFLCNYSSSSSNQSNPYLPVFVKQRVNSLLMSFTTTTTAIKRYRSKGQMPSKAVKLQRGGGGGGINAHSFSHHQHQEEEGKQGALIETIEVVVVVVVVIAGSVCFLKLLLPLIKCHLNCAVQCK